MTFLFLSKWNNSIVLSHGLIKKREKENEHNWHLHLYNNEKSTQAFYLFTFFNNQMDLKSGN